MTLIVKAQQPPLLADKDGVMRVGGTRIPLDTVIHAFDEGSTAEEIASRYPVLKLADIYAVIAYYLNEREAVQQYLSQHEAAVAKTWEEIEARADYRLFRQRLLARTRHSSS
jgi:uncharacterized protein (DUF433 family)